MGFTRPAGKSTIDVVWKAALLLLCAACGSNQMLTPPTPVPVASVPVTSRAVSGTVLASGSPVQNALVDLLGVGGFHYAFTGPDGRYRLVDPPTGPTVLRIGKWGFRTQMVSLTIDGDVSRSVTLLPGNSPPPLAIGARVASVVKLDDMICATSDPGTEDGEGGLGLVGPCKTFLLTVPKDGDLVATATWPGKDMYMTVLTASHGRCCSSPLTLRFPVTAGSMVELAVSLHASDLLPLGATAPFELTTTLEQGGGANR